jgi:nitroreductase
MPDSGKPAGIGTLEQLLEQRFSCRAFLPSPVARPTIERMLRAAQRTASWCNSQPWQVVVTSGEATEMLREALYAHALENASNHDFPTPARYAGAYLERRRACGLQLYESVGIARGETDRAHRQAMENYRLFGAPHACIVTTEADLGVYGAVDCGGYVATLLLAAESLGIAAIPQASLAAYPDFIRKHFGLAAGRRVVCGVSFGYADRDHPANRFRTGRAALEDVVTWEDAASADTGSGERP